MMSQSPSGNPCRYMLGFIFYLYKHRDRTAESRSAHPPMYTKSHRCVILHTYAFCVHIFEKMTVEK
mgnify:CR=1 FL=1